MFDIANLSIRIFVFEFYNNINYFETYSDFMLHNPNIEVISINSGIVRDIESIYNYSDIFVNKIADY